MLFHGRRIQTVPDAKLWGFFYINISAKSARRINSWPVGTISTSPHLFREKKEDVILLQKCQPTRTAFGGCVNINININ
jgi:hypothetical protein